jgi:uncharacterized protein (DUF2384 family)
LRVLVVVLIVIEGLIRNALDATFSGGPKGILMREAAMLTTDDKEEIRRIVAETLLTKSAASSTEDRKRADEVEQFEQLLKMTARIHDLIVNEGFTDLTFLNPATGEKRVVEIKAEARPIVEVTARAMEVFGTRERALRWLNSPVRSLGDQTPLSLLNSPEGVAQVQDTLGRAEHGVW